MYHKIVLVILIMCLTFLPHTLINAEEDNVTMTRAELANVVMETYEYITQEFSLPIEERTVFSDINQSLFQIRIVQAHIKGFMNGVGDEKFLPNENVTKCQATVTLYRLMQKLNQKYGLKQEEKQVDISDLEIAPDWAIESIVFMVSTNLISLRGSKFYADELASKNEIHKVIKKIKDIFIISDDSERIDFQTFLERIN